MSKTESHLDDKEARVGDDDDTKAVSVILRGNRILKCDTDHQSAIESEREREREEEIEEDDGGLHFIKTR